MEGGGHNYDSRNMNQALNTGHYTVPVVPCPIIHYNPLNLALGLSCPVQALNQLQESMTAKDPEGGSGGISFGGLSTVPAEGSAAYGQAEVAYPLTVPDFSSVPMTVWTPPAPDYSYGESSGNSGWDALPAQNLLQFDQYAAAQPMQQPQQLMYFNNESMMYMDGGDFSTESYGWRSSNGDYQEVGFNTHSNNTIMLEGVPDLNYPITEPQTPSVPADVVGHGVQFFRHEHEDQAYGMIDEDGLWLRGITADAASAGPVFQEAPTLEMIAEMVNRYHAMYSQLDSHANPNYDPTERDRFINEINNAIADAYRAGIVRPEEIHALPTPMPIHFVDDYYYADPPLGDQNNDQYDEDEDDEVDSLEEFDGSLGISEFLIESNVNRRKYEPPAIVPADEKGRDQCCICQLEYDEGAEIGKLVCNHEYHYECIKKWLLVKNCCPYCQRKAIEV